MKTRMVDAQAGATLSIVVAGIIFGSAFLCTKILVEELTILQFVTARMVLGAAAVTAFLLVGDRRPKITPGVLFSATLLALADALIPYMLIAWGETRINSGTAAVLISTMPLFTALFAQVLSKDANLSPSKLSGLTVGFVGVAVIASGNGAGALATPSAGAAAVVCAAMSYAAAAVYARRALTKTDAATLNAVKLAIGAIIVLPVAFSLDGLPAAGALDTRGVVALVWIGMVTTGIARVAYFRAVAVAGSVRASLVTYIVPVSGAALGSIVLGEPLHAHSVAGFALIISGVALVMCAAPLRRAVARLTASVRGPVVAAAAVTREGR